MVYEYEDFIRGRVSGTSAFVSDKVYRELQEVYFKAEILNRIISSVKNGRSLGSDTDSEIILRAIEHELKYTEDE